MVYLHKIFDDKQRVTYEYGAEKESSIGTISFDIDCLPEIDISARKLELDFYENHSFCHLTTSALQGISKFIRENSFPSEYLRATH